MNRRTRGVRSVCIQALCLVAVSAHLAQGEPLASAPAGDNGTIPARASPSPAKTRQSYECTRCKEKVDPLLGRGDWAAAEAEARTAIAEQLQGRDTDLLTPLSQLAVAEAGLGRDEDALWHWQVAQAIGDAGDLSRYGAPARLLAKTLPRRLGQAPAGVVVRREGDGSGPLTPARKISGEDPRLAGTLSTLPLGMRVEVIVDREGRPRYPVVAASTLPALTCVVLEALRGWRFTPAQAGGEPVASFYELIIPEQQPLERIANFSQSPLAKPLQLLKAARFAEADEKLRKIWEDAQGAEQKRVFLAMALALKALADAGLGREDAAICRFQAAQTLEPRLVGADLAAFGAAGALLMRHPWGALGSQWERSGVRAEASRGEVTNPERLGGRDPALPTYARKLGIQGRLVIKSIVSEAGMLQDLLLLRPSLSVGIDANTLDALCDWRFKPALWLGKPIPIYYTFTLTLAIRER
ncbi:MAG TPA: energy transducer TonB [Thermoanaerobaculia bacterium]|nr:energy transducer TonB [Thermoanaerobaculia bacterium]